ncbi:MAG: hypothetical protein IKU45_06515, partial [Clostridia bacterium]|nr:hypothetical protein [Clostridia bacterium]
MKKFFASVVMFVLCFFILGTANARVDAAVVGTDTLSVGQVWTKSWSSSTDYLTVNLDVEQSGFYTFSITDHKRTGAFAVNVYDCTTMQSVGFIYEEGKSVASHTSNEIYLVNAHEYELYVAYGETEGENTLDAYLSIQFNRASVVPVELPNCYVGASSLTVQFDETVNSLWTSYKTTGAGDYSFEFTNLHAYIYVYEKSTGNCVTVRDTEYWDSFYDEYTLVHNKVVFPLAANTEYYIYIDSYESATCKLSMTKNQKSIIGIEAVRLVDEIDSFSDVNELDYSDFYYKMSFNDGTKVDAISSDSVASSGYELPYVEYVGNTVWIQSNEYFQGGYQPVESTYNGKTTTLYIYIMPISHMI